MATILSSLSLDATKPLHDKKHYRVITLSNGIRCLLIHEPIETATTASLSLAVSGGAGSFSDPIYRQGLAHFCEHMVFMGSEKYPKENDYDSYLSKHGGNSNAFTELETTCYVTSVQQNVLEETLDRFSYFFYKPLFSIGSVQREIRAVDSEFKQGTSDDDILLSQIMAHSFVADHPLACFSWGNRRSLALPDSIVTPSNNGNKSTGTVETKEEEQDTKDNDDNTTVNPSTPSIPSRTINIDSLITDLKTFYYRVYNTRYMHLVIQANGDSLYSKYANALHHQPEQAKDNGSKDKKGTIATVPGLDVLQYLVLKTFGRIPLTAAPSSSSSSKNSPPCPVIDYNMILPIPSPLLTIPSLVSSSISSPIPGSTILNPYQSIQYLQSIYGIADRSILRGDQWYNRSSFRTSNGGKYSSVSSLQHLTHGGYAYGPLYTSDPSVPKTSSPGTYYMSPIATFSLPSSSSSSPTVSATPTASTPFVHFMPPSKNKHTLSIAWSLPALPNMYKYRPYELLGHLLGHEARGSLLYILRRTGYIVSLSAGVDDSGMDNNRICCLFTISMNCTTKGILAYKLILQIIFSYIQYVLCNGINIGAVVPDMYRLSSLGETKEHVTTTTMTTTTTVGPFVPPYSVASPDITVSDAKEYREIQKQVLAKAYDAYPFTKPSTSLLLSTPTTAAVTTTSTISSTTIPYPDYSFIGRKFPSPFIASSSVPLPPSLIGLSTFLGYTIPLPLLDTLYTNTLHYYGMQKEIAQTSLINYRYQDEGDRLDTVEAIAYSMATLATPDNDILLAANDIFGNPSVQEGKSKCQDGTTDDKGIPIAMEPKEEEKDEDTYGFAPAMVTFLLTHFIPQNCRIDILTPFVKNTVYPDNQTDPIFHLPVRDGLRIDQEDNSIHDNTDVVQETGSTDDDDESGNDNDEENEGTHDEAGSQSNRTSSSTRHSSGGQPHHPLSSRSRRSRSKSASEEEADDDDEDDEDNDNMDSSSEANGTDDDDDENESDDGDDEGEDTTNGADNTKDDFESGTHMYHLLENQLPSAKLLTEWEKRNVQRYTEPYWGRSYVQIPIDPDTLHSWIHPPSPLTIIDILQERENRTAHHHHRDNMVPSESTELLLHYPAENPYIPTDLTLKPLPTRNNMANHTSSPVTIEPESVASPSPLTNGASIGKEMKEERNERETEIPTEITRIAFGLDPVPFESLSVPPDAYSLVPLLHSQRSIPPTIPSSSSLPSHASIPSASFLVGRCWHKQDTIYRLPRTHIHTFIHLPSLYTNVHHILYADLWYYIVKQYLNEDTYYASLGSLECSLSPSRLGCEIEISGFTDKVGVLLRKLIRTLTLTAFGDSSTEEVCARLQLTEDKFYLLVEQRYRIMDNQYRSLSSQSNNDYYRILECDNRNLSTIYGTDQEAMSYETRLEIYQATLRYAASTYPQQQPRHPESSMDAPRSASASLSSLSSSSTTTITPTSTTYAPLLYQEFLRYIGIRPSSSSVSSSPSSSTVPSLWSSMITTPILIDILVHGNEDTTSANEYLRILYTAINPAISTYLRCLPPNYLSSYLHNSSRTFASFTTPPGTFRDTTVHSVSSNPTVLSLSSLYPRYSWLTIPSGTTIVRTFVSRSNDEVNGYTCYHIQAGYDSSSSNPTLRTLVEVMEDLLYEPFYDSLRTKQQLGYEVNIRKICEEDNGALGINFIVKSAEYSPMEVRKRIETFLYDYRSTLEKLCTCGSNGKPGGSKNGRHNRSPKGKNDGDRPVFVPSKCPLDEQLEAIIEQKLNDIEGLEEEAWQYWIEIRGGRTQFLRHQDEIRILRSWLSASSAAVHQHQHHYGHQVLLNFYDQIILHTPSSLMEDNESTGMDTLTLQKGNGNNKKSKTKKSSGRTKIGTSSSSGGTTAQIRPSPLDEYRSGGGRLCIQVLGKQAKWYQDTLLNSNDDSSGNNHNNSGKTKKSSGSNGNGNGSRKNNAKETSSTRTGSTYDILITGPPNVISEWKQATLGTLTLDETTIGMNEGNNTIGKTSMNSNPKDQPNSGSSPKKGKNSTMNNNNPNRWKYSGPVYRREEE